MTFRVHFYAEQAFLSQTKVMLDRRCSDEEPEAAAMCILACASAVEATANSLLSKEINFRHFDELRITSKIEKILIFGGTEPDWSVEPWQSVSRLIKMRNWLAHYKDYDIGLVNSDFEWIHDSVNKTPSIDPYKELTFEKAQKYYDKSREALHILVQSSGADGSAFDFLLTEQYIPFLVG